MKIKKKLLYFFFELSPFADLDVESFNNGISKTIIGRSFNLGQLIKDDELLLIGEN